MEKETKVIDKKELFLFKGAINDINSHNEKRIEAINTIITYSTNENFNYLLNALKELNNDFDKTYILLNANQLSNNNKEKMLSLIKNEYYRSIIVKQIVVQDFTINDLMPQLMQFYYWEQELNNLPTEEEKAKYISGIYDNNAKIALLVHIKERKNRDTIINSLTNRIDVSLQPYVELVQGMIEEWIEDYLIDKSDFQKLEKMKMAFNRTNVEVSENLNSNTSGQSRHLSDKILINSKKTNNISYLIDVLIHEYSHIFSRFDYKYTKYCSPNMLEEGMADLFSELVINHYIEKHKKLEVNGKQVRIDYPYISYSSYDTENAWARTMLFSLGKKMNNAEEATIEYILGDKARYIELCLGKEKSDSLERDGFGNIKINFTLEELFKAKEQDLINVDRNSVFYRRNFILPLFEIQARVGIDKCNIVKVKEISVETVAKAYFGDKRIFQIARSDMEQFINLLDLTCYRRIKNYDNYMNAKINELTDEEIQKFSFEVLNNSIPLLKNLKNAGSNMERVYFSAFEIETSKIHAQSISENLRKYAALYNAYYKILSSSNSFSNRYILEAVKNYKSQVIDMLESKLQEGKKEEVTKDLTDELKTRDLFDKSIIEVLSKFGIDYKCEITTEDILGAANAIGLQLDEIRKK